MAGLMPAYILREWTNDGKLLHGGLVHLYESGTTTPKPAYTDSTYAVPLPNPVVLDAGGAADIWLGDGAYRVWITDSNGVQIRPPVDGITGSGSGIGGTANVTSVMRYADLRALTSVPDAVYVAGRTAEGDGGQGWFQLVPSSTLVDDDGVVLTSASGTHVYVRIFASYIDPRWYGVAYGGSVDQSAHILAAMSGSQRWNVPVLMTGIVFLTQSVTMPGSSQLQCGMNSYFVGGSSVTVTFPTSTRVSGLGIIFGANVQPIIGSGVADALRLSWFGGDTDSARWAKLIASTGSNYSVLADITTTIVLDLDVPANFAVDFVGGSQLIIGSALSLAIRNLVYDGMLQVFVYPASGRCTALTLVSQRIRAEWFGATLPAWDALFHCHRWDLVQDTAYSTPAGTLSYAHAFSITGDSGSTWDNAATVTTGVTDITGVTISGSGSLSASLLALTNVISTLALSSSTPAIISDSALAHNTQPIDNIGVCSNAQLIGFHGQMSGDFTNGGIVASGTISVAADLTITTAALRKTPADDPTIAPLFKFTAYNNDKQHELVIRGGTVKLMAAMTDPECVLIYGSDATRLQYDTLTLDNVRQDYLFNTTLLGNPVELVYADWRNALSNGFTNVVMTGCGFTHSTPASALYSDQTLQRNNQSAYVCDGVANDATYKITGAIATSSTVTALVTDWKGPAGVTLLSDGDSISTTVPMTLSSDPKSTNTLRWAGPADGSNAFYNALFSYGGRVELVVELPGGGTADPGMRLTVHAVFGGISLAVASGTGYPRSVTYSDTAKAIPVGFNSVAGSKSRTVMNLWSGCVPFRCNDSQNVTYTFSDIWGDYTRTLNQSSTLTQMMRFVIVNEGTGTVPAGTKFKLIMTQCLPDVVTYRKFWPAPAAVDAGPFLYPLSSTIAGLDSLEYKHPYTYRLATSSRLEMDLARELAVGGSGVGPNRIGWANPSRDIFVDINKS